VLKHIWYTNRSCKDVFEKLHYPFLHNTLSIRGYIKFFSRIQYFNAEISSRYFSSTKILNPKFWLYIYTIDRNPKEMYWLKSRVVQMHCIHAVLLYHYIIVLLCNGIIVSCNCLSKRDVFHISQVISSQKNS